MPNPVRRPAGDNKRRTVLAQLDNLSETYPAVAASVPRARRALTFFAMRAGALRRQVEEIGLAGSEAVTNVVLHAYPAGEGNIYVTAAVTSGELWILVADDGCGFRPRPDSPGLGLGLVLIADVTDEVAIVARSHGGTEVRMRFDLPDSGHSTSRSPARVL
jgi:serine/threonine-protein kinase RsbW